MKGDKINTISEFDAIVKSGAPSVWADNWKRPSPVAFLCSWQYVRLVNLIERGYLFTNIPTPKRDRFAAIPFQKQSK